MNCHCKDVSRAELHNLFRPTVTWLLRLTSVSILLGHVGHAGGLGPRERRGKRARARCLSEQRLWLSVAAILSLGSSFSIHRGCGELHVGRLGRIRWCCAPARWSYRGRDRRLHLVLYMPAETFEELRWWPNQRTATRISRHISTSYVRVGVVVGDGGSRVAAPTGGSACLRVLLGGVVVVTACGVV